MNSSWFYLNRGNLSHHNLYANVVSSGGTVMFQGTGERMKCAEVLFQPNFIGKGATEIHGIFSR